MGWEYQADITGPKGDKGDTGPRIWTRIWDNGPMSITTTRQNIMLDGSFDIDDYDQLSFLFGPVDGCYVIGMCPVSVVEENSNTGVGACVRFATEADVQMYVRRNTAGTVLLIQRRAISNDFNLFAIWGVETV